MYFNFAYCQLLNFLLPSLTPAVVYSAGALSTCHLQLLSLARMTSSAYASTTSGTNDTLPVITGNGMFLHGLKSTKCQQMLERVRTRCFACFIFCWSVECCSLPFLSSGADFLVYPVICTFSPDDPNKLKAVMAS